MVKERSNVCFASLRLLDERILDQVPAMMCYEPRLNCIIFDSIESESQASSFLIQRFLIFFSFFFSVFVYVLQDDRVECMH